MPCDGKPQLCRRTTRRLSMDDRRRLSPPCGPQPASVTANNPLALRGPKPHRPEASPGSQPASSERPPHTGSPWLTAPRAARPVDPGPRRCPGSWKAFERPQHLTGRPGPPYANWALKLVPAGHGRKAPGGVSFALACAAQRPSRARLQTGHHVRRRAEPLPLRQGYVRLLTSQLRRRENSLVWSARGPGCSSVALDSTRAFQMPATTRSGTTSGQGSSWQ
jgi:hypothetical protein